MHIAVSGDYGYQQTAAQAGVSTGGSVAGVAGKAIGGLLSSEDIKSIQSIPFVSSIPIIGELFKNKQFTKNETELIILVTPKLIQNGQPVPIPMPKG